MYSKTEAQEERRTTETTNSGTHGLTAILCQSATRSTNLILDQGSRYLEPSRATDAYSRTGATVVLVTC